MIAQLVLSIIGNSGIMARLRYIYILSFPLIKSMSINKSMTLLYCTESEN